MIPAFDYKKLILPPTATVRKAIEVMSGPQGAGIVLVAGKDGRLIGVVVDSDIRKAILKGQGLETALRAVMNPNPVTLPADMSRESIIRFFQTTPRASIPLVDARGRVKGVAQMSAYLTQVREMPNWIVLLAGGEGKRLLPLTEHRPKPLLHVGDKPILETIIEQFTAAGFSRFILAVNHQADQIRRHFGDGTKLGVEIRYIQETKSLGTAGPLSLLPPGVEDPLIVMNGDLLTKIDFRALLNFHSEEKSLATLCVREYDFQVPFGVVQMEHQRLLEIVEKPTHKFFVNAGIYVLEPKVLAGLKKDAHCDMPAFLDSIRRKKAGSVNCFPIREYWIDIGRIEEYKRAQAEYQKFFGS